MNDLRAHFRPEFLNRLDETILFKPLTKENIGGIVGLLIADVNKRLADKELTIVLSDSAKQFIVENGYDLSINKYKKTEYVAVEYPSSEEIMDKLDTLEKQIAAELIELRDMLK